MSHVININTLEELYQFLNEKGIMEIALRNKDKRFKVFQKIAINDLNQLEGKGKIEEAIALLNKNNALLDNNLNVINNIAALNKLALVMNGLNLCATCIGFAIMKKELNAISGQISQVLRQSKDTQSIYSEYELNKVVSDHISMLDNRRTRKYDSEAKMRELVSEEFNVLNLLTDIFMTEISSNRKELIFSILSLASMLAASIKFFDEAYYFENRDVIDGPDKWYSDHDRWVSVFDKLASKEFIKKVQDCGLFEIALNTFEIDSLYMGFRDQIISLKQEIEDNQIMISTVDDEEILKTIAEQTSREIQYEIEQVFANVGADISLCDKALKVAVA